MKGSARSPERRRRRLLARALGVALTLCALGIAGELRAQIEVPARLVSLSWVGVRHLEPAALREVMFTPVRPWWRIWESPPLLDETLLAADMDRIVALYREHGYYHARVRYALEWNEARDSARAVVTVDEGEAVRLAAWSVDLSELDSLEWDGRAQLLDDLPLREGEVFSLARYREARRLLLARMADRGHPDATISGGGEVNLATLRATVSWRLHPGEAVRFGALRIDGLGRVDEALVRRELTVREGDPYSESELRRSQQRVSDLGLFRSVLITADDPPGETGERALRLELEERPLRSVQFGLGYGTEERVRVQAGWLHRNTFGRGDLLEVRGRHSSLASEVEVSLREPRLPDPRTSLVLATRMRSETLPAYDALGLRNSIGVERPLARGWSGRVAYVLDWTRIENVPGIASDELERPEGRFRLSHFELGARRITTDDLVDPTRGSWLELSAEPSLSWLGSDVGYLRWWFDARAFVPVRSVVFAARGLLGSIDALGESKAEDLPVTKLFFAGGSNSVRGYEYQRLGPTDAEGNPIGGTSLITASLEARFPLRGALRGVLFVDAGQLESEPRTWRLDALNYAVGAGLRYATPFGPVRVDVGFPLDRPDGAPHVRVWLSIGQAF